MTDEKVLAVAVADPPSIVCRKIELPPRPVAKVGVIDTTAGPHRHPLVFQAVAGLR